MMKWKKVTKVYMWAEYFSEDGKWKSWDKDITVKTNRKEYNPRTRKIEAVTGLRHIWLLQNLQTGEMIPQEFKTLKAAKEYAENA